MEETVVNNEAVNNELVLNVTSSEIIIALLENKQLVEINKEKSNKRFAVGDIYLGKVKKIMPGLNAAFVDIGYEKDAFLHYLDLGPQFLSLNKFVQKGQKDKTNIFPTEILQLGNEIDKDGKISDVLTVGQQIMVQIAKEPISTKGPRLSSEISIAGRNIVLMPFSNKVSISQKIKSAEERNRLKRLILSIRPQNYGVIVRTVAKTKKVATLDAELRELVEKWETAFLKLKSIASPALIIGELDRTSAILRDILNSSFNSINVNNEAVYEEIRNFISTIAPEKQKIVKLYKGRVPIFEFFGIDKQIKALFGKTVTIRTGAYLIVEHTEALHVIDVNSGNRSKRENNQETNALEVNLLAAEEIARQLRLRDMGGIIVVDFIDMHDLENKKKVFEKMREVMAKDRTKHNILPLSKFGIMQITRQRVRPEMHISTAESCPTCNGSGKIGPSILLIDEIENNIRYIFNTLSKVQLTIKMHPFVAAFLRTGFPSIRLKWLFKYKKIIRISSQDSYGFFEYHFFDKSDDEIIL
jgi:ribonuclease G